MRTVQIYDTTLRDGSQGEGVNFSLHDKIQITERLAEIGVDYVEGGYPLSNEKDAAFFQRAKGLSLGKTRVCAFGMTRRRGMAASEDPGMIALLESGAGVVTIVGKTSSFHATEVLRVSLDENIEMIQDTVAYLKSQGRQVIYDAEHFFDGWKLDPAYSARTIQAAAEAGASLVVLCDTNGGSLPEEVAQLTRAATWALEKLGVPVGIHCHNDCELAVANSLAAVDAGAVQVQGTINGLGERCGNADLISVIGNLALKKKGYEVLGGSSVGHLTELSRYVYDLANFQRRINQPFVGQSAFAHKGGMHVHAINRVTSSYEHIDPQQVGNTRRILVSELSGRSNIVAMTSRHRLDNDKAMLDKILAEVVRRENQGYQYEAAEASFELLVMQTAGTYTSHFDLVKFHVEVGKRPGQGTVTESTVKITVNGELRHEVAEGDGPVNALDAALRKALNGTFPVLAEMRLVDYKVRVVNSDAGTAAKIRVLIESADNEGSWGTIGVSENIIEASWIALTDAIEYKLHKERIANKSATAPAIAAAT